MPIEVAPGNPDPSIEDLLRIIAATLVETNQQLAKIQQVLVQWYVHDANLPPGAVVDLR